MGRPFNEKFADVVWESVNDSDSEPDTSSEDESPSVKGQINSYFKTTGKGKEKAPQEEVREEKAATNFERWKIGMTGYPIVDAAMRCANEMGWMHNRMRMITAMFLCKHLMLDWREGERVSFHVTPMKNVAGRLCNFLLTRTRFLVLYADFDRWRSGE